MRNSALVLTTGRPPGNSLFLLEPAAASLVLLTLALAGPALAQDAAHDPADRQLFFGEQHLHSSWSLDATAAGTRQKPEDAYRWALGEEVTLSTTGEKIKKDTPYDFVA